MPRLVFPKLALPKLDISQQNVGYYASLGTYYSIYDLRRLRPEQTHLYLLCYLASLPAIERQPGRRL